MLRKENELAYWLVGESTLVSESKENDFPSHVFYECHVCKIILLFVVVKLIRRLRNKINFYLVAKSRM